MISKGEDSACSADFYGNDQTTKTTFIYISSEIHMCIAFSIIFKYIPASESWWMAGTARTLRIGALQMYPIRLTTEYPTFPTSQKITCIFQMWTQNQILSI